MKYRTLAIVASILTCTSSLAAHVVTETRNGSALLKQTHTYANAAGDLRIDEHGIIATASAVSSAAGGGSSVTTKYAPGDVEDTTIFQVKGRTIVSLEGATCRRITADSAPPPGLGPAAGNMRDYSKQMGDAMQQARAAMEQAMAQARREGMTAEQERALQQYTQPFMEAPNREPRGALQLEKLDRRVSVGGYSGEGYLVKNSAGEEKHRIWLVPAKDIAGGTDIRRAMQGMFDTYSEYLEKMGGGALMETSLATMFSGEELDGMYPVRIEDIDSGDITDLVAAHRASADVEYYPDCTVKDMFGQ